MILLILCSQSETAPLFSATELEIEAAHQWFSKGKFFFEKKKDLLKASECFNRALDVNPNHKDALKYINIIRKKLDLPEKIRSLDKDNSRGWFLKGRYLCDFKKDYKSAIECFEKALLHDPGNKAASDLLEKTRKRVEYSLDAEHSLGIASEEFQRASKFLIDKDFVSALNSYKKGIEKFKNNTQALLAYFRTAQRLGQREDILKALDLLEAQVKFGLITRFDIESIVQELKCYKNRLEIELAYRAYNRDKRILELFFDNFTLGFFKEIPQKLERYKEAFKKMSVLDVKLLSDFGYLKENLSCPGGPGIYFLNDMSGVECTVHGITSNTISIDSKSNKDYAASSSNANMDSELTLRGVSNKSTIADVDSDFKFMTKVADKLALKDREVIKSRKVYNAAIALGDVNVENKSYEKALKNYERAIIIDSSDALGYIKKGTVLYLQQKFEDSLASFMDATDRDPYSYEAWNNIGNCYSELKETKDGIEAYEKALEIKPDYFKANYNLGFTLLKSKKPEKASKCLEKALDIDPEDFSARYYLANALIELNRLSEAVNQLKIIKRTVKKGSSIEKIVSSLILRISKIRDGQ